MNRDDFLSRVRDAAKQGRAYRVHVEPDMRPEVGYVGGGDNLAQQLAAEVTAVGGTATIVADLAGARRALEELLDRHRPQRALCWQHPLLDRLGLGTLLSGRGIVADDCDTLLTLSAEVARERMLGADIGITSVSHAIAETGSLVMMSRPGQERLASLLPPVHVAIVERSQILPDLFDLFSELAQAGYDNLPSNLAFITGPSKTGDIELTLTTGVHGPGTWHVIVIE